MEASGNGATPRAVITAVQGALHLQSEIRFLPTA